MQSVVAVTKHDANRFTVAASAYDGCIKAMAGSSQALAICAQLKQDVSFSLAGNAGKRAGGLRAIL